jgi:hypothetical protein
MPTPSITDIDRFLARVEQRGANQCWWWTGAVDQPRGYPKMKLRDGSQKSVARFAWEIVYLRGPLPAGYVLTRAEHDWDPCPDPRTCVHRMCMNPGHMRPAWKPSLDAERMRAMVSQPKTHCRRNHPLTDDNVVWISRAKNKRMCRICHDAWRASHALSQP